MFVPDGLYLVRYCTQPGVPETESVLGDPVLCVHADYEKGVFRFAACIDSYEEGFDYHPDPPTTFEVDRVCEWGAPLIGGMAWVDDTPVDGFPVRERTKWGFVRCTREEE